MTRIAWNSPGERFYEAGVDRGVLYFPGETGGYPWNGLVNVTEKPTGGAAVPYYIDGIKYLNVADPTDFTASIEAYTYPDEWARAEGTAMHVKGGLGYTLQDPEMFHLTYRTKVGNDIDGTDHAYIIHFIYNALAVPTQKSRATISEDVDPDTFTWELTTTPPSIEKRRPTAHLIVDSRTTDPYLLAFIEDHLYGSSAFIPGMPTPEWLTNIFNTWVTLEIIDNGDGTWDAVGPDEVVFLTSETEFVIDWPSAVPISADSYTLTTK